ncbi:MAG: 4-(cytidine 5'-diphospho)-2-C-methyl-D-erythritol kinase [Alphaproteobacteria bacterium]
MSSSASAPLKLNLCLHVTGRRADGYHTLETVVVFAALADRLEVREGEGLALTLGGEFAGDTGSVEDNLVLRAARVLRERTGCRRGAALSLEKNIPAGAGFGGGSADAAAALRLLNGFWKLGLSEKELAAIGIALGADVPMCLASRPLLARGIGEEIAPLDAPLPPLHAVLAWPRRKLATKDVFAAFDGRTHHCERSESGEPVHPAPPLRHGEFFEWLALMRNDLEAPATVLMPQVGEVLQALRDASPAPEFVRMSGSGSGAYALVATAGEAQAIAGAVHARHPDWWVAATEIIPSPARP